jgi:hypothetical protein
MTKFFGKPFLSNFAVGIVTGIVLDFQFGMNWSAYSRFVGDAFGSPRNTDSMKNASGPAIATGSTRSPTAGGATFAALAGGLGLRVHRGDYRGYRGDTLR